MSTIHTNKISEEKRGLRQSIKLLKNSFDNEQKLKSSEEIFKQLEDFPEFISAKTILAYWSLPDEVDTHSFIDRWYKEKTILLPVIDGNNLEFRIYTGRDCMISEDVFGILEPQKGLPADIGIVDFAIIPGVAFDLQGNRLGRGKGYYDKALKKHSFFKVGVCFPFQLVPKVPTGAFDVKMDRILYS